MLAQLCLAAAAALALVKVRDWFPRPLAAAVTVVAIAGALADGWIRSLPMASLPARFASLESLAGGAVAEVPVTDMVAGIAALYRSSYHRRPTSTATAASCRITTRSCARRSMPTGWRRSMRSPARTVHSPSSTRSAASSARATPVRPIRCQPGRALPIHEVKLRDASLALTPLTDGDGRTRWDSDAPQDGTEAITIDLGSPNRLNAVMLAIGPYSADFPRLLAIDVSDDLHSWTMQWSGRCGAKAVAAAVKDARMVPLTVSFPPTTARYVRLRQLGADALYHWSIAELVGATGGERSQGRP